MYGIRMDNGFTTVGAHGKILSISTWVIASLLLSGTAAQISMANIALLEDFPPNWVSKPVRETMLAPALGVEQRTNVSFHSAPVIYRFNMSDTFRAMRQVCVDLSLARAPVHVTFTALECDSSSYVTSVLSHMRIPVISVRQDKCVRYQNNLYFESKSPFEIELAVGRSHVIQVLEYLIMVQEWKKFIIFYDSFYDNPVLGDILIESLQQMNATASLFEISNNATEIQSILVAAKRTPEYAYPYIVLTSENTTTGVLIEARKLEMTGQEYRWLLRGDYGAHVIQPHLNNEDNIVLVTKWDGNLDKAQAEYMIEEAFDSVVRAYDELSDKNEWPEDHKSTPALPGCKSPIAEARRLEVADSIKKHLPAESRFNDTYTEFGIMTAVARMNAGPQMEEVASWTSDKMLEWSGELYPNSFNGFNNRTFTIASLEYSFFQQKVYQADGSVKWVGLTFTLLDELARDLNFSYVVVEPPDGHWGIADENGNWDGMMAQVINKSVDFAAAGFSITAGRETVVDFAEPYFYDLSAVIIKRPASDNKLALYLKPFSWKVWVSVLASVFVYGLLLWMFTMNSAYYDLKAGTAEHVHGGYSLQNTLLYFYGSFVQQGGVWMPPSQSGRILVGFFWFYVIVVVATYTGNLIAFLAVNTISLPFNSLSELIQQNKLEYGPAAGVAMVMLFRDANFEPYKSVYKGMKLAESYGEGIARVKKGEYAFIAEKSYYQGEVAKDCSLAMMKDTFYPTNYGMAFPEKSTVVKLFSDRINKMREAGLLTHWTKQWTPRALNCTGLRPVTNAKVVDLTDFQGALYVLGGGVFVGICALLAELCAYCHRRHKLRNVLPQFSTTKTDEAILIAGFSGVVKETAIGASPGRVTNGNRSEIALDTEQGTET